MSIENRLKEERNRLGFNQLDFAALAGRTKKTMIDYEKGISSPDAKFLSAIAAIGADVQYILTGIRSQQTVTTEPPANYVELTKKKLIKGIDDLSPEQQAELTKQVDLMRRLNQYEVELKEFKKKVG